MLKAGRVVVIKQEHEAVWEPGRKESRSGMGKVRRVRTKTRRVLYFFLFLFARPTELLLLIGLLVVAVGQIINIITYGVLRKRDTLVTWGPYAWCRNPFYVGTFLSDFGFCAMCNLTDIAVAVITAGYAVAQGTFYYFQILGEEKLLLGIHGENYMDYCERVRWRLLPSLVSALKNGGFRVGWSAGLAFRNRIFSRAVSAVFWICVFWAVREMSGSGMTRIINMDVSWTAALRNPYIMATAGSAALCYYLLRFGESRERKKAESEEAEGVPA